MKLFTCILDPDGRGILETTRREYERLPRSMGLGCRWHSIGQASVLTAGDDGRSPPLIATHGLHAAVGMVRLDNRADLTKLSGSEASLTDLDTVLRAVERHGVKAAPQLLGDFAFITWNSATRTAVAMVDAFALKKLYYVERNGLIAFASRAEALALDDGGYEVQYFAELVAMCSPSPGLSPYEGVHPLPAGTVAIVDLGRLTLTRYWTPYAFEPEVRRTTAEGEAAEACRHLLARSVELCLNGTGDTWAQLSGGIDSSAVVGTTQWLLERGAVQHGLAGTITYVDREGTEADERAYSTLLIKRWGLRNEVILNPPFWYDTRHELPRTDFPGFTLPFYPREQRLCAIVQAAGGRVLLTGIGGDELFTGTMLFFADWVSQGRVWPAIREMARRAAIGRVSFWDLAYRNAVLPLLPSAVRAAILRRRTPAPPWLSRTVVRRYRLSARGIMASEYGGRVGHKYQDAIARNITTLGSDLEYGTIADLLDVRHPFLYRPLVEFALQLPPELCVRPYARKWILREAMRGILPEALRARIGKGGPAALYCWSLTAQRGLLEPLVRKPILADLGIVDPVSFREAFDTVPNEPRKSDERHATLHMALVIEAWLQMRVGRWPCGGYLSTAA